MIEIKKITKYLDIKDNKEMIKMIENHNLKYKRKKLIPIILYIKFVELINKILLLTLIIIKMDLEMTDTLKYVVNLQHIFRFLCTFIFFIFLFFQYKNNSIKNSIIYNIHYYFIYLFLY